jgi:hypothetical protein
VVKAKEGLGEALAEEASLSAEFMAIFSTAPFGVRGNLSGKSCSYQNVDKKI